MPGLDAIEYVQGDNWLGVALAALMRIPPDRIAWLGAEALRRLTEAPLTEQQRFLLGECVEAYLPLSERQQAEFDTLIRAPSHEKVRAMNKTTFEKGMEKGMEKGRGEGMQDTLLEIGARKFGSPSREIEQQVRSIDDVQHLQQLTKRLWDASSWDELLAAGTFSAK